MGAILFKLIYSALLLGISGVLLRELWTVWFDDQIYIGSFEVVSEAGNDAEAGAAFAKRIVGAQAIFARQLQDYQTRGGADSPTDATYLLPGTTPLLLPPKALEGVDVTIQNVNLTQLLTVVRKGFLAPNEVRGHVTMRPGSVIAAVEWPRAPRSADGRPPLVHFLTPSRPDVQEAAADVACALSWARAASLEPSIAAVARAQFCDFTTALSDLYSLSGKASSVRGLSDEETTLVRSRAAQLRTHYGSENVFPEIYRLRADLLELVPEGVRTQGELVEAQEDRVRYAMESPTVRDLPEEEQRLTALALARPAMLLEPGRPLPAPANWLSLLARHEAAIRAAEMSTGLIARSGAPVGTGFIGTGFIVGPGLLMTSKYVLAGMRDQLGGGHGAQDGQAPRLCLGPSASECEPSLRIGDVVHEDEGSLIVIVSLMNHDQTLYPPLPLFTGLPETNTFIGRYAYVIGYSFFDASTPEPFLRELVGGVYGHRRLMPGRILAFGVDNPFSRFASESDPLAMFTTDMSTTRGTAGGPLVDLSTGAVIGVSHGGQWHGERGKFAYAEPITAAALGLVDRRVHGERDQPGRHTTGETPPGVAASHR